jgi:hypothetical protein
MQTFLNRRTLAVSFLPTFLQTVLLISTVLSKTIANSPRYNSLINTSNDNYKLTFTLAMASENPYTPLRNNDIEGDITFHDTIERRQSTTSNSNSIASADNSVASPHRPTTLIDSPIIAPPASINPKMTTIKIGGLTISVETTEQARTTTGALYTKAIRATYDNDKKGKLDLLKLIQSKQQQPYVATSISVNDPEKLLNHYSLSKLNKECSRNLNKYDLIGAFTNVVYPISPGAQELKTDPSGAFLTHNLFSNTFQVTAQQVADSSRWYSGFTATSARFQEDLEWSLAYFENNVDSALYARIHAKLLSYDERCQGGPLFFKLLNDETTTNSEANKKALITIVETYKIRSSCKGERIVDVVDLFHSITDTVYALHDDSLPDEYVDKLISLFTTTSVTEFNDLFEVLKKQLFAAQLQASITDSLIVPIDGSSLLTNNLKGANYVLEYAGKAFYTLSQRGSWDKCLQQVPGESALINPTDGSTGSTFEIKCFNCGGPHHLRLCPQQRDQATINRNRGNHPSKNRGEQPTSFRGNRPTRPAKWRLPEEGENNKRIIDNKPYTFNPNNTRWELDPTPDSGQQQKAANVIPPTAPPPSAPPTLPPSPAATLPDMKGAFFNGYGSPDMNKEAQKHVLALEMMRLKQVWENM